VLTSGFTNTLQIATSFTVLSGGSLTVAGGSITVNNGFTIDGGALLSAGTVTVNSNLVVGDCGAGVTGTVSIAGGSLYVTNGTQTAVLNVQNGTFTISNGVVQADTLLITNTCAQFFHIGGTLIASNVVIDPNLFQIVSLAQQTNDMLVTWLMGPGAINALQATSGDASGNYNTNGFTDIFVVTNNPSLGTITNYLDLGAATNLATRYYRARLAP
jgi:hypothetical protein